MRALRSHNQSHGALLLLLPLILLAISTFMLDERLSASVDPQLRFFILLCLRLFFPCCFALLAALIIPRAISLWQIFCVASSYLILLIILGKDGSDFIINPSICVLCAMSSLCVIRSASPGGGTRRRAFRVMDNLLTLALPYIVMIASWVILSQVRSFVLYVFNDAFARSLLSMIFAPIFLFLQTLGFQDWVSQIAAVRYQNDLISPFINAIYVTNLFSLPAIILCRSFFTEGAERLFLTMLAMTAVLSSPVGTCLSLIYLLLIIFWPGTFSGLLLCSLCYYLCSYAMNVPALTSISNLYMPDLDLALSAPFLYSPSIVSLEIIAVILPIFYIIVMMFVNRESFGRTTRRKDFVKIGLKADALNNPDLLVIALLRSLGGISNLRKVQAEDGVLRLTIVNPNPVSEAFINALCQKRVHYDRNNRILTCHIGDQYLTVGFKLEGLLKNEFGHEANEPCVPPSFHIVPMPHIHKKMQG